MSSAAAIPASDAKQQSTTLPSSVIFLSHFCEVHGPTILMCTSAEAEADAGSSDGASAGGSKDVESESEYHKQSDDCCCSLGNISIVTPAKSGHIFSFTSGIPTRLPTQLYSRLRRACLRSLSVEVSPGGEGAVLFQDGEGGHAVSYVFRLSDTRARGGRRLVSLVFLANDRNALLLVWDEIVSQLHRTAAEWRARAHWRFLRERQGLAGGMDVQNVQNQSSRSASRGRGRDRGRERAASSRSQSRAHAHAAMISSPPAKMLQSSGGRPGQLRSFADLFLVPGLSLWRRLHISHCVSLYGFVKRLASMRIVPAVSSRLLSFQEIDGQNIECSLTSVKFNPVEAFCSLNDISFKVIMYNLLVGNQVIVRSTHADICAQIVNWLSCFIPSNCCRAVPFSNTYQDVWICNLLGLDPKVRLPKHVKSPDYAIIDVLCLCNSKNEDGDDGSLKMPGGGGQGIEWEGMGIVGSIQPRGLSTEGHGYGYGRKHNQTMSEALDMSLDTSCFILPALPGAESEEFFASFDIGTPPGSDVDVDVDVDRGRMLTTVEEEGLNGNGGKGKVTDPDSDPDSDTTNLFGHSWICCGAGSETTLGEEIFMTIRDKLINSESRQYVLETLKVKWMDKANVFARFLKSPDPDNAVRLYRFLDAIECTVADLPVVRFWSTNRRSADSEGPFVEVKVKSS